MLVRMILGVDEAGRGPLAGPIAVGIVAVPSEIDLLAIFPTLNDSKKLTEKKRESIFDSLAEYSYIEHRVEWVCVEEIDAQGLTAPIASAIARGLEALAIEGKVYLDGLLKAPPHYEQETVTGGDGIIPAIMLASVVAKVSRDRLMIELDAKYPEYGFTQHKGYGTKAHYEALRMHGPSEEHRKLFLRNFI